MNTSSLASRHDRKLLLVTFGLAVALMVFTVCRAGEAASPLAGVLSCRAIAADSARLACFDRESAALARAGSIARSLHAPSRSSPVPSASSARGTGAAGAAAAALDPQRTFGLSRAAILDRETAAAGLRVSSVSSITARISSLGTAPDGRTVFRLENGQVWEQLVNDGSSINARPGQTVRISRRSLGSFWLQAQSGWGYKVARLH